MRLAVVGLSAVLMSGCSWLGGSYGASGYGADCVPDYSACGGTQFAGQYGAGAYGVQSGAYGTQAYGAQGYGAQVSGGQYAAYGSNAGVADAAYGAGGLNGYGQYGAAGVGYAGAYGVPGQVGVVAGQQTGLGAFGNGTVTTLGGAAPFGAAYSGQGLGGGVYGQSVVGSQYASGQFAGGAVQTVQGAPIYVPQPYGVPVGVGVAGPAIGAAALPFGLALLGGTDFDVDGDVLGAKPAGPGLTADPSIPPTNEAGAQEALSYSDAFGEAKRIGFALERDISPSTTLLGQFAYATANGQRIDGYASSTPGTYDPVTGAFVQTPGTTTEVLDAEFSDLNTYTAEAGIRQYLGRPSGLRPYIGATAGAVYNEGVDYRQTFTGTDTEFSNVEDFIDSGWNPTASGVIGAEAAVGKRGAIGIESGVRWTDGLDVAGGGADDRISIPVTLRGRVAF